jgi:hypothetical protein
MYIIINERVVQDACNNINYYYLYVKIRLENFLKITWIKLNEKQLFKKFKGISAFILIF